MTSLTALRLGESGRCRKDDLLALLLGLTLLSPASTPLVWSGLLTCCCVLPAGGCWAGELSVYVSLPELTRSTEPQIPMDEHLIVEGRFIMCKNIPFEKWKHEAIDLCANRGHQPRFQHAMHDQWNTERYMDSGGSDAWTAPCGQSPCSQPGNHDL
ncbi:hypothetical protein [Xanthomonas hortorum]|uniref:hypothetical protein n=1 Tax=Xanthomonas hortorum TaxID=56454 RepID=UPI00159376E2|nr:hypothetical protein [Xanthomonas hortorum]NHF65516.1 hypothetical protein [Xanthomonas hortorum]